MTLDSFPGDSFVDSYDVLCFSHLRWDFVFQRPQHLLTRFARDHRVLFVEEPIHGDGEPRFAVTQKSDGLRIAVPHIPHGYDARDCEEFLRRSIPDLLHNEGVRNFISWYYTPMMLSWSNHLDPVAVVYDCMDELSAFKNAPTELREREQELFDLADLVFTGGRTLYEAKREQHDSVHCFPSSIDVKHFAQALEPGSDPDDQANIPHPRIGFFGVIDERTDIELLREIASLKPDWHFVMIGPVVKISEDSLPHAANIHYLGGKSYDELPNYISGWEVAMMPFAINESTKFISPTKTPEYLAAGRPVVSTPIRDVVRPYGEKGLVHIAATPDEFVKAIEAALSVDLEDHRSRANELLETMSWDKTYDAMSALIHEVIIEKRVPRAQATV